MTTLPTDLKTTFTSHANLIKTVNILDVSKPDSVPVSQDVAVLRSRHYSDLQAYLYTVLRTIPPNADAWNSTLPEAKFSKLNDLDPSIYGQTRDTLTSVYTHCSDFDGKTMAKFLTLASSIISLCDQSIQAINAPDIGLLAQCAVLSAEQSDPSSPAFKHAYSLAAAMIGRLATAAQSTANDCVPLQNEMRAFSTLTAVDRDSVKFVHGQFYGPVLIVKGGEPKFDSAGQPVKPYAEVLAQQIVDLQTTVRNLTAAAESEMAEYKYDLVVATTTPTYMWFFPCGTIAAAATFGIYTAKAVSAKSDYDRDTAEIAKDNVDLLTLQNVLDQLKSMDVMIGGVSSTIDAAIEALGQIQILLANQAQGFRDIKTAMVSAQGDIADEDQIIRSLVNADVATAVDHYYKVKQEMTWFMLDATNVYSNVSVATR